MESHLITGIGEHYYSALAKGPLVEDHVLIVPVEHLPNTLSMPEDCEIELNRVQNSLKAYFENQGKQVVFFEWVFKRATHANLQVCCLLLLFNEYRRLLLYFAFFCRWELIILFFALV